MLGLKGATKKLKPASQILAFALKFFVGKIETKQCGCIVGWRFELADKSGPLSYGPNAQLVLSDTGQWDRSMAEKLAATAGLLDIEFKSDTKKAQSELKGYVRRASRYVRGIIGGSRALMPAGDWNPVREKQKIDRKIEWIDRKIEQLMSLAPEPTSALAYLISPIQREKAQEGFGSAQK